MISEPLSPNPRTSIRVYVDKQRNSHFQGKTIIKIIILVIRITRTMNSPQ